MPHEIAANRIVARAGEFLFAHRLAAQAVEFREHAIARGPQGLGFGPDIAEEMPLLAADPVRGADGVGQPLLIAQGGEKARRHPLAHQGRGQAQRRIVGRGDRDGRVAEADHALLDLFREAQIAALGRVGLARLKAGFRQRAGRAEPLFDRLARLVFGQIAHDRDDHVRGLHGLRMQRHHLVARQTVDRFRLSLEGAGVGMALVKGFEKPLVSELK